MTDENTNTITDSAGQDAQAAPENTYPSGPEMTPEEAQAHKDSLISVFEEKLAAIPHEIVADLKAVWAAIKAHL